MSQSSFRRQLAAVAAAAALGALALPAQADVRYDFTAQSSFDFNGETFSGAFSVVLPDFVTANTTVPVEALSSCSVTASSSAPASCGPQQFLFDVSAGYTTVAFGVQTEANPGTSIYYYFDGASFSTPGSYDSQIFGGDQFATLVVTSAVPEPATWAALLAGLAGVGLAVRRRTAR